MKTAALLLCLVACQAPSYFETHAGASEGSADWSGPGRDYENESYYVGVTVGWNLGVTHQAALNMAALDVNRAGELSLDHEEHDTPDLTVNLGDEAEEAAPEPDLTTKVVDKLLEKPEPGEEWNYMVWVAALCAAIWVLFSVKRPKNG